MNRQGKKLSLTEDTLIDLLDECNKEITSLKLESKALYDAWKNRVNEIGEIAMAGGNIIKLLDLRDKNIDKKLKLISQLSTIINESKKSSKADDDDDTKTNENYNIPDNILSQIDSALNVKK
jgi:hypothetical protein